MQTTAPLDMWAQVFRPSASYHKEQTMRTFITSIAINSPTGWITCQPDWAGRGQVDEKRPTLSYAHGMPSAPSRRFADKSSNWQQNVGFRVADHTDIAQRKRLCRY
jgi:hypothetical protein